MDEIELIAKLELDPNTKYYGLIFSIPFGQWQDLHEEVEQAISETLVKDGFSPDKFSVVVVPNDVQLKEIKEFDE